MNKIYPIGGNVKIGYSPEHNAREFRFDLTKFMAMWPDTKPKMLVQRKGDCSTYIADTRMDGNHIVWLVTRYDTSKVGTGQMWIAFYGANDDQLGLTPATKIIVEGGPPNACGYIPPETAIPWVQKVLEAADKIENLSIKPPFIAKETVEEFPIPGDEEVLYKAQDEKRLYQWNDENQAYEPLSSGSIFDFSEINGGAAENGIYGAIIVPEYQLINGGSSDGTT